MTPVYTLIDSREVGVIMHISQRKLFSFQSVDYNYLTYVDPGANFGSDIRTTLSYHTYHTKLIIPLVVIYS